MLILAVVSVPLLHLDNLAYVLERCARGWPGVSPPWLALLFIEIAAAMNVLWPLVFVVLAAVLYWMHSSSLRVLRVHAVVAVCLVAVMIFLSAMYDAQQKAMFSRYKEYRRIQVELKQGRY
jgi:apolipoprotein N-acyltransferase